jgi:hypothetical protein
MSMRIRNARILSAGLAVAVAIVAVNPDGASAATRKVPQGFAGVAIDPWELNREGVSVSAELNRAASAGVESVRFPIYWFDLQPYRGGSYTWRALDEFFTAAGRVHMALTPNLIGAPKWAADPRYIGGSSQVTMPIPKDPNEFAKFASDVVSRYKPGGTFWADNPSLNQPTIRSWQIWNEPDFTRFWPQHLGETQTVTVAGKRVTSKDLRFAHSFLQLLRPTSAAIRAADPNAKIMLGSFTNIAWDSVARFYKAGGKSLGKSGLYDSIGLNFFTSKPSSLVTAISKTRSALRSFGDSQIPITLSEYSWTSAAGITFPDMKLRYIAMSSKAQATNLTSAFSSLVSNRAKLGIDSTYWYSWATPDKGNSTIWDYSGLRAYGTGKVVDKPALAAFSKVALAAEGCRWKLQADSCSPTAPLLRKP